MSTSPGFFARAFSSFVGALTALLFVGGFLLLLLIGFVAGSDSTPAVPSEAVLVVDLGGPLLEEAPLDPFAELATEVPPLREVLLGLDMAAADERIAAVWLRPNGVQASWAALEEVRDALERVRASGTPIFAHPTAAGFDQPGYFLATAADSILSPPVASFDMTGFGASVTFFADLFDELGIEAQAIRAGDYKSAVEPFTRTSLSEANAFQLRALLADRARRFSIAVSEGRGLAPQEVETLIDGGRVLAATDAAEVGLLDALWYEDELVEHLAARLGLADDDDLPTVSLSDYVQTSPSQAGLDFEDDARIAVVYASGTILNGDSGSDVVMGPVLGADTFIEAIDDALTDPKVAALVVRIDSPGGDATAADAMWRAVVNAKAEVPVVASMAGVAASGGYYIAAPADTIVADPLTITGSIGVFSILFDASDFLESRLFLDTDTVLTAPFADLYSSSKPLDAAERALLEREVDRIYDTFRERVAEGRGLPRDTVDLLAGGRVYTGEDAHAVGLVDELGGLNLAVELAAELAALEPGRYRLRTFPQPPPLFDRIVGQLLSSPGIRQWGQLQRSTSLPPEAQAWVRQLAPLAEASRLHATPQARLPWVLAP
ncbi:MAG: signal peptide peptidase SppA [Bacteroidota bacterium]